MSWPVTQACGTYLKFTTFWEKKMGKESGRQGGQVGWKEEGGCKSRRGKEELDG